MSIKETKCAHSYSYGGLKYAISELSLPGTGARAVYYSDWFYCTHCLENKFTNIRQHGTSYDQVLDNATPGGELPETAKHRWSW
jgi:hypothetical protein